MTEIIPGLYIAGVRDVMHEVETKCRNVTHILNVAPEVTCDRSDDGYHYRCVGVDDDDPTGDITSSLESNTAWIHKALSNNGVVMVSCWGGVSRSAVTVMAYLVRYRDLSPVDAYHKVLARRPIVEPWPRYLTQFQQWANSIA